MKKTGFTLIELMVTVAIIAILVSVAIPAYQNYTVRARVTEGLALADSAKIAVSESTHSNGGILPATAAAAGYQPPSATAYVTSIGISNGIITITYNNQAGNGTIVMTPTVVSGSGEITWSCRSGTLLDKYRPSNCRVNS